MEKRRFYQRTIHIVNGINDLNELSRVESRGEEPSRAESSREEQSRGEAIVYLRAIHILIKVNELSRGERRRAETR